LSGQVLEVLPGGSRVPIPDFPVLAVILAPGTCSRPCVSTINWLYHDTRTGPDGTYQFAELPSGSAVLLADNAGPYRQVCGAGVDLSINTRLDLEVTSKANPQPSPTTPLVLTGQIYEMTPSGRVGVPGAWLGLDHHYPDVPFFGAIFSDADGRYAVCGIPAGWPMYIGAGQTGFEHAFVSHTFTANTTLDIEIRRP
jgi:hypothetical protein